MCGCAHGRAATAVFFLRKNASARDLFAAAAVRGKLLLGRSGTVRRAVQSAAAQKS